MATIVVLGASPKPDRYAHRAQQQLMAAGHTVLPVRPGGGDILGLEVLADLTAITTPVDAVTLYVGPQRLETMVGDLIALAPPVVIANPGTEDPAIEARLTAAGIRVLPACTLVLLASGQFDRAIAVD